MQPGGRPYRLKLPQERFLKKYSEIGGWLLWLYYYRRSEETWEILESLGVNAGRVLVSATIGPPNVPGVSQKLGNFLVAEAVICHIILERGQVAAERAAAVLVALAEDVIVSPYVRATAAGRVLELALKSKDQEELETRIEELEEAMR